MINIIWEDNYMTIYKHSTQSLKIKFIKCLSRVVSIVFSPNLRIHSMPKNSTQEK